MDSLLAHGLSAAISPRGLEKAEWPIDVAFPAGDTAVGILLDILVAPLRPAGAPETREQHLEKAKGLHPDKTF